MKAHPNYDRPSRGLLLVALLALTLDLVLIGLLSFGPTPAWLGLGLIAAWLLSVILFCSKRIRDESVDFLRKFLGAARDFNG